MSHNLPVFGKVSGIKKLFSEVSIEYSQIHNQILEQFSSFRRIECKDELEGWMLLLMSTFLEESLFLNDSIPYLNYLRKNFLNQLFQNESLFPNINPDEISAEFIQLIDNLIQLQIQIQPTQSSELLFSQIQNSPRIQKDLINIIAPNIDNEKLCSPNQSTNIINFIKMFGKIIQFSIVYYDPLPYHYEIEDSENTLYLLHLPSNPQQFMILYSKKTDVFTKNRQSSINTKSILQTIPISNSYSYSNQNNMEELLKISTQIISTFSQIFQTQNYNTQNINEYESQVIQKTYDSIHQLNQSYDQLHSIDTTSNLINSCVSHIIDNLQNSISTLAFFQQNNLKLAQNFCQNCEEERLNTIRLQCGHQFCKSCLSERVMLAKHIFGSKEVQITCFKCFYILNEFELCLCLGSAYLEFNETINLKCFICTNHDISCKILNIHDEHNICQNCFIKIMKRYEIPEVNLDLLQKNADFPFSKIKCPGRQCQTEVEPVSFQNFIEFFSPDELKNILEQSFQRKRIDHESPQIQQIIITIINPPDPLEKKLSIEKEEEKEIFSCPICFDNYDKIYTLKGCHHQFCENCLKNHIKSESEKGKGIHSISCPYSPKESGNCQALVNPETIAELVDKTIFEKLTLRTIEIDFNLFSCPLCNVKFEIPKDYHSKIITCMMCKTKICRLCNQKEHPGECNKDRILLITSMKKNGQNVSPCPYCLQLSVLMEGCDHVKCYVCHNDFCIACSCKRSPIMAHGNHYHRPSCPHFFKGDGKDKYLEKCEECKKLQKLCSPPKNLENGDIPKSERPHLF